MMDNHAEVEKKINVKVRLSEDPHNGHNRKLKIWNHFNFNNDH